MSIYDNVAYGPRIHGIKNKAQLDEIVERSLKGAALWDEVSDRFKEICTGTFRWSAAASLYCKSAGSRAGGSVNG